MLNDQERRIDPANQPTNVVVTTPAVSHTVERVETVPEATRVDVYPQPAATTNQFVNDRATQPLYPRQDVVRQRRYGVGKSIDLVWYVLGALEIVLAARFFFELTAANSAAGFVKFIFGLSQPFAWPFKGIFSVPSDGNNVFDTNILIGMVVWAIIAWGVTRLLAMTIEPPSVT